MPALSARTRTHRDVQKNTVDDLAHHVCEIKHDDGVYRHLLCRQHSTNNRYFHITTWPGHLCISGDMGTFVFSRLHDMFDFHRGRHEPGRRIDLAYWAQKLEAHDTPNGHKEFSFSYYREVIHEMGKSFIEGHDMDRDQRRDFWWHVNEEVFAHHDTSAQLPVQRAMAFEYRMKRKPGEMSSLFARDVHYPFADLWDYGDLSVHTYHYVWCCYAIRWAIQQYDRQKARLLPVPLTGPGNVTCMVCKGHGYTVFRPTFMPMFVFTKVNLTQCAMCHGTGTCAPDRLSVYNQEHWSKTP